MWRRPEAFALGESPVLPGWVLPAAASQRGTEALTDAIAIVLGIIIVFELPQKWFRVLARIGHRSGGSP